MADTLSMRLLLCLCFLTGPVAVVADTKPNVVFILTDDQSTKLESVQHMPKLQEHFGSAGVELKNTFTATPVCCPSRSSIYTGKYIHNIGVFNNSAGSGGCGSLAWQSGPERNNIAYFMSQQGYATSFAGKYLNQYGAATGSDTLSLPACLNSTMTMDAFRMESACAQLLTHVPRGWTNWQGLKGNSVYYNYSLSNNGVVEKHGDDYHADYLIDIVKNRSVAFMDEHLSDGTPIFVVASVPAAHEPADPAPQYANYGENLTAPRTPNYNLVIDDDARHWMIDQVNVDASPMNSTVISWVDHLYRRRLATLQSVDDLIDSFVECLDRHGQMDQTYMVYTADNGYHLGQFAVALDKRQPYETDVRVPFFARGPGILAGVVLTQGTMLNIDLAPTFLEFAGATYAEIEALGMDGEPMGWLLRGEEASPASIGGGAMEEDPTAREFLIEYFGENWDGCYAYLANSFPDGSFDKLDDGLDCGTRGANSFLTPPYWSGETWSSIQDTANNTYGCVRSINSTKDYQYCEWDSGEVEYFDVTEDEWQLHNLAPGMSPDLRAAYHAKLEKLRGCDGRAGCAAATKS